MRPLDALIALVAGVIIAIISGMAIYVVTFLTEMIRIDRESIRGTQRMREQQNLYANAQAALLAYAEQLGQELVK